MQTAVLDKQEWGRVNIHHNSFSLGVLRGNDSGLQNLREGNMEGMSQTTRPFWKISGSFYALLVGFKIFQKKNLSKKVSIANCRKEALFD